MRGPDHATYMGVRHFGSLDGLRFLCITAVIWHHLGLWSQLENPITLAVRGHVGVDFFFVLSGYLITTLLLREETRDGSYSLRGFYWRRILRIVPIYFFVVTVAAIWSIGIKGETGYLSILPAYYLFLSNFLAVKDIPFLSPTWSLAVEEQFYLVWPLLLMLVPRRWILPVLGVLIVHNVASAAGLFDLVGITGISVGAFHFAIAKATYAPLFFGAGLAIALNAPRGFGAIARVTGFRAAAPVWFAVVLGVLSLDWGPLAGIPNFFVHLSMTLMLAALVVREDNGLAPILRLRPIERIGQVSYGIYLYHLFALTIMGKLFETLGWWNYPVLMLSYYALAWAMAEISFRTLEAYFMGFRKRGWGRTPAVREGAT
ncbi:MAG: putative acyltransferase [Rhodobacteraceae bacterium HLUCCA08]|nr:MAG: putative acyltransferase [Rhodobacteraceae bacterium HLUCCA08]